MRARSLNALTLVLVVLLHAPLPLARAASPVSPTLLLQRDARLSQEFQDMNARITQIQAVKSLPFFGLDPSARAARVATWYGHARQGQVRALAGAVGQDFAVGGVVHDMAVAAATDVLFRMAQGASLEDSVNASWGHMTSVQFLLGQTCGGLAGAALGAIVPVPLLGGALGAMVAGVPMMLGATVGGTMGYALVDAMASGADNPFAALATLDYPGLVAQSLGAAVGTVLGGLILPGVPLAPVVAGVAGATVGRNVLAWLVRNSSTAWAAVTTVRERPPLDERTAEPAVGTQEAAPTPSAPTPTTAASHAASYRAVLDEAVAGNRSALTAALTTWGDASAALAEARSR